MLDERNKALCESYRNGEPMTSISKRSGLSCSQLSRIFQEAGVKRKLYELDLEYFEANKGQTKRQISENTGLTLKRVGHLYRVAYGKPLSKGQVDFSGCLPSVDPDLISDPTWLRAMYNDNKFGSPAIAKLLATKASLVIKALKKFGIPIRTIRSAAQLMSKRPDKIWLTKHYNDIGWSIQRCADEFGTGFDSIHASLIEYGIELRDASEQHVGRLNEFFGKTHSDLTRQLCSQIGAVHGPQYWLTGDIEAKRALASSNSKILWTDPARRLADSERITKLCQEGKCNPKSRIFYSKSGLSMLLRSSWEEVIAEFIDGCAEVAKWAYEDTVLKYVDSAGNISNFIVDFTVDWLDGTRSLIESKNRYLLSKDDEQLKIRALVDHCNVNNYGCVLVSDESQVKQMLHGYHSPVTWNGHMYHATNGLSKGALLVQEVAVHEITRKIIPWRGLDYTDDQLRQDLAKTTAEKLHYVKDGVWRSTVSNSGGMPGRKLMSHFNPHFWEVAPRNKKPLIEAFKDPYIVTANIRRSLGEGESLSLERLLREINFHCPGYGRASFFAPGLARTVYRHFGVAGKRIVDPCIGWGGRLLGAWLENCQYFGYEISDLSYNGAVGLASYIGYQPQLMNISCLEADWPESDLVFTSPPYYDAERYVGGNQPWMRFTTREAWVAGFVVPFLDKVGQRLTALYIDCHTLKDFEQVRKFDEIIVVNNKKHARRKTGEEFICVYRPR